MSKDPNGTQTGTTLYREASPQGTEGDYPAGGAMRVTTTSPQTNNLYYILSDHLSSTSVVTDEYGVEIGRMGYFPFGETRYTSGSLFTDRLITPCSYAGLHRPAGEQLH